MLFVLTPRLGVLEAITVHRACVVSYRRVAKMRRPACDITDSTKKGPPSSQIITLDGRKASTPFLKTLWETSH